MTKPRLVIHAGPMKTGTTAIGAYFSDAKSAGILPKNVVYPTHDLWFPRHRDERQGGRITKHNQLSDFFLRGNGATPVRKLDVVTPEQIEEKVAQIASFASTSVGPDATVVFVSEGVSSWETGPSLLDMFARYFGDITMVIAVRSPIAAAQSLLVHRVKDWRFDQLDLDLAAFLNGGDMVDRFNYDKLLKRWLSHTGFTVKLVPYFEDESDGYAVVDRLMNIVTGTDAPRLDDDFGSRRIHPSLPLSSLNRLIALKKIDRRWSGVPFVSTMVRRIFDRTLLGDRQKVVQGGFTARSAEHGDWVLSPEQRAIAQNYFQSSFDALKAALGPAAKSGDWARWFALQGV